jgi:hypothetical protein
MLKSELMAASGPSSSQTPTSPVGNHSAVAVTAALENALNFALTAARGFYENCRDDTFRVLLKSAIVKRRVNIGVANKRRAGEHAMRLAITTWCRTP